MSLRAEGLSPLPCSLETTCLLLVPAAPSWCLPHQRRGDSLGAQIFPLSEEAQSKQQPTVCVQTVREGLPRERGSWTIFWHSSCCIRDREMRKSLLWAAAKRGRRAVSFKVMQDHCHAEDICYVHQWVLVFLVTGWRMSRNTCLHSPNSHLGLGCRSSCAVQVWCRSCGVQQPQPGRLRGSWAGRTSPREWVPARQQCPRLSGTVKKPSRSVIPPLNDKLTESQVGRTFRQEGGA